MYKCKHCGKDDFKSIYSLEKHLKTDHREEGYDVNNIPMQMLQQFLNAKPDPNAPNPPPVP